MMLNFNDFREKRLCLIQVKSALNTLIPTTGAFVAYSASHEAWFAVSPRLWGISTADVVERYPGATMWQLTHYEEQILSFQWLDYEIKGLV